MNPSIGLSVVAAMLLSAARLVPGAQTDDAYERYVQTSKDFRRVRQDPAWCRQAFPSWTYMPWTYQWTIGYDDAAGKWSVDHGYNGAFIDHGDIAADASPTGRLDWIDRFKLRFYMDHMAGKGYLHLYDGDQVQPHLAALHGSGIRTPPVNLSMRQTLQDMIRDNINAVKSSPYRAAYALDDEISWGHFVHPTMWRVTDDPDAYPNWLKEVYGLEAPRRSAWVTYDDIRSKLDSWTIGAFDASTLMDQWTFNDSYWNNFLGDLVEYANSVDPHTPCGFVGGQSPSAFGGYDYAKLMRKVQFIEAYNIGSSQAVIRSFNPSNAIPSVTTHFHHSAADDVWQTWYYLAHGNRGFIGWVQGWFDGKTPRAWHEQVAPTYLEADNKIGPLLAGAQWIHDGVAIYYSHPSIQLGWIMDAQAHGKTWINRNNDDRLGSPVMVRRAWENMLRDSGLQYSFLSYADVIQERIPGEYRVLILPACLCLSDAETRRIEAFCRRGGTVIADYMPGLWDQHGKGRLQGGALDAMFGVRHDPALKSSDVFNGKNLWCEVDQDANFNWKSYEEFLTNQNTCIKDSSGFNKAVRAMPVIQTNRYGQGTAVLMNLSPQWYNAYRSQGAGPARRRAAFIDPITHAGVRRWVELKGDADRLHGYEITYWRQGGRTILLVTLNPELSVSPTGGGNAVALKADTIPVVLHFVPPVHGARDERAGRALGDGTDFPFRWKMNEAIVVSLEGPLPR